MAEQQSDDLFACVELFRLRFQHKGMQRQFVRKNQYVFHSGDAVHGMHLVVDGLVKVSRITYSGQEKVIDIASRGDFLGEVPLLLEQTYDITARAVSDVVLVFMPEQIVFTLLQESSTILRRLIGAMARKAHGLVQNIESNFKSGHERVVDFLLSHAPANLAKNDPLVVVLHIKKTELASQLCLTGQHFSRILKDLREKGLIVIDGYVIYVPCVNSLRNGYLRFGQSESVFLSPP